MTKTDGDSFVLKCPERRPTVGIGRLCMHDLSSPHHILLEEDDLRDMNRTGRIAHILRHGAWAMPCGPSSPCSSSSDWEDLHEHGAWHHAMHIGSPRCSIQGSSGPKSGPHAHS